MNGKRAKSIRRKAKQMYNSFDDLNKKKTSEKRVYNWLKKVYKRGENK